VDSIKLSVAAVLAEHNAGALGGGLGCDLDQLVTGLARLIRGSRVDGVAARRLGYVGRAAAEVDVGIRSAADDRGRAQARYADLVRAELDGALVSHPADVEELANLARAAEVFIHQRSRDVACSKFRDCRNIRAPLLGTWDIRV
jgi:hypothetical protein